MMTKPSPSIEYLQHPHMYLEREVAIGKRLLILAESENGDYYNPTLVYSKEMAIDFFGGGALVQAYEDASTYQKGLHAYLMRIEPYGYETAFAVLESFDFDLLFLKDVHFNKNNEVIHQFLEFARVKEEKGNLVHGITTLSSGLRYQDLTSLFPLIQSLTEERGDETIERGKYLSLVVHQMEFQDAGAVYAGLLTSIEPEVSPINKTIPNVSLSFEFSKPEIHQLRSVGIVCFHQTFKKGITCTSSSCAVSTEGSVHKHISNFRIAQHLINQVSNELHPLIGMPNVLHQSHNVEGIVESICMEHIELKRIRDFGYSVGVDELYGLIDVQIELVPIFSVHSMTTHSRVRIFK